jgi:hypothetical protein
MFGVKSTIDHPTGAAGTQTLPIVAQSTAPDEDELLEAPPTPTLEELLEEPPPLAVELLPVEPLVTLVDARVPLVELAFVALLPDGDAPPLPCWSPPVANGQPVSESERRSAAMTAAPRWRWGSRR